MPTIGVFAGAKSSPKMSAMDEVCTCCVATAGHGDVWARVSHPSHSHNTTSLFAVHAATALPSLPAAHATTTRPSSDPQPSSHGSSTALPPPSSSVRCTRWPPWLRSTPGREPHPASSAMIVHCLLDSRTSFSQLKLLIEWSNLESCVPEVIFRPLACLRSSFKNDHEMQRSCAGFSGQEGTAVTSVTLGLAKAKIHVQKT
jgi:hypothetical protein